MSNPQLRRKPAHPSLQSRIPSTSQLSMVFCSPTTEPASPTAPPKKPIKERIPSRKTHPYHPSPITETYAQVLQNIYRNKSQYNNFYDADPKARTSTDRWKCGPGKLRYRCEASKPRRWRGEGECNMGTYSTSPWGILLDVKMEAHDMEERPEVEMDLFPETWVIDRCDTDTLLYPQYGRFRCKETQDAMTKWRLEGQKKLRLPIDFSPFLMRIFTDSRVTKSSLPAPWCNMHERTFWHWFTRNMKALGIGRRFSWAKLCAMKRQEQIDQWRADDADEPTSEEVWMLLNLLPVEAVEQLLTPVEESKEEESAMALETKEQLKGLEEAKKERKRAARRFAARQQERDAKDAVKAQGEVSILERWMIFWTRSSQK